MVPNNPNPDVAMTEAGQLTCPTHRISLELSVCLQLPREATAIVEQYNEMFSVQCS